MFENEPSMTKIDDFNGTESKEKKALVNKIVFYILVAGTIYTGIKYFTGESSDYLGVSGKASVRV